MKHTFNRFRTLCLMAFAALLMAPSLAFATDPTDTSTLTNAAVSAITGKGAPTVTIYQAVIGFVALVAIATLIISLIRRK